MTNLPAIRDQDQYVTIESCYMQCRACAWYTTTNARTGERAYLKARARYEAHWRRDHAKPALSSADNPKEE